VEAVGKGEAAGTVTRGGSGGDAGTRCRARCGVGARRGGRSCHSNVAGKESFPGLGGNCPGIPTEPGETGAGGKDLQVSVQK